MAEFTRVCELIDISLKEPLIVEIDGQPVALCRRGDSVFAIEDVCPHQGASFDGGEIEDDVLTCPLHGWRANFCTGQSLEAPGLQLQTYETKIENGIVFVRLTD
jgi:nitrite reductase (NADH) small subunit